jgi:predicted NBD/HSP70 family sugar kinase
MKKYLTIDIGRTHLRYAIITEKLDILETGKEYTSIDNKEGVFNPIKSVAERYIGKVEGASLTMPGVIDREKGIAHSGGVYGWVKDFNYADELSAYIGMPVVIANDAKAAALAEMGYGALKNVKNGLMLMILNTGIGGAVILDGKLVNGEHYASAEVSYMRGDYKNRDGYDDMFALANSVDGLSRAVERSSGRKNLNILRIMAKLNEKDEDVKRGVEEYCDMLATYIYNIQCVIDADVCVIGGNIMDGPVMLKMISEALDRKFDDAVYKNIFRPRIKESVFHSNSRMYGAVYNYRMLKGE